jgi:hypothetical protein
VEGFCDGGNERVGSIKVRGFLDNCGLLKNKSAFFFFFLSSTAIGGLWLPSQLAAMYFVPVLPLSNTFAS